MKIHLCLTLIFFQCFFAFAQTDSASAEQTKAVEEIIKLNQQIVQLYKEKKFDEALSIGKKIQTIAAANNLTGDTRILTPFGNLAEVYLAKSRESEAISLLEVISTAYEKMGDKGKKSLEKTLSRLAYVHMLKKDYKNAEIVYVKLKPLVETIYGEESRQSANIYLNLGNLYSLERKDADADNFYEKAILINDKILTDKEKEIREDVDIFTCSIYRQAFEKGDIRKNDHLFDDFYKKRGISPDDHLNQGIINGKAKNLAIPQYPQSARNKRASGFAIAKVDIDEQGNVTKAKAFCGYLDFVEEVENAAKKSTFTPTLENGIPIKVSGMIVYNFVAR